MGVEGLELSSGNNVKRQADLNGGLSVVAIHPISAELVSEMSKRIVRSTGATLLNLHCDESG